MKQEQTSIAQKFSKLASRVVQSIAPAFSKLANKVQSAKPVFQRTVQAAICNFLPQPQAQPVLAAAAVKPPQHRR